MMTVEKDKASEDQIERMKQKNQLLLDKFQASEEDRKRAEDHGSTIKKEQNVTLRMRPEDEPKLRNNRSMGPRPKSFHGNSYHDNQDYQVQNQFNDNRKPNKFRATKFNEEAAAYQDYRHFQQTHTNKSFNNNNNNRPIFRQNSHSNYPEEPNTHRSNYHEFNRSYNQSMRNRVPPRFAQNYYQNTRISKENDFHSQNRPVNTEFNNQHRMSKDNEFYNHPNAKIHRDEFHNSHANNRSFKETEFHNQHYVNTKIQKEDFHNHQNSNTRFSKDHEFSNARMPKDESLNQGFPYSRNSKDNEAYNQQYSNTRVPKNEHHNQGFQYPRNSKEIDYDNQHYYVKIPKEEYYKHEYSRKFPEKDLHNQKSNPQNTRNNIHRSNSNQSYKKPSKSKSKQFGNGNKSAAYGPGNSNAKPTRKPSAFDDEYIDDTLEDLEQYRLKVDMEDFIVIDPESEDPILAMPLKPWSNTDIMNSIECNKFDKELQSNEISTRVLDCANERSREYLNLMCRNTSDVCCSNPDVDGGSNLHEKNLTNFNSNSQLENKKSDKTNIISENFENLKINKDLRNDDNNCEQSINTGQKIESGDEMKKAEFEVEAIEKDIRNTTKEIELIEDEIKNSIKVEKETEVVKNPDTCAEMLKENEDTSKHDEEIKEITSANEEVEVMEETTHTDKDEEIDENNSNTDKVKIEDKTNTDMDVKIMEGKTNADKVKIEDKTNTDKEVQIIEETTHTDKKEEIVENNSNAADKVKIEGKTNADNEVKTIEEKTNADNGAEIMEERNVITDCSTSQSESVKETDMAKSDEQISADSTENVSAELDSVQNNISDPETATVA